MNERKGITSTNNLWIWSDYNWQCIFKGEPGGSDGKESPAMQETRVQSLGQEDPLEKGMATHFNILPWTISRTEEPGGLQSMGHKESNMIERLIFSLFRGENNNLNKLI